MYISIRAMNPAGASGGMEAFFLGLIFYFLFFIFFGLG